MVASAKAKVLKEPSDRVNTSIMRRGGRTGEKSVILLLRKNRPVQHALRSLIRTTTPRILPIHKICQVNGRLSQKMKVKFKERARAFYF